jgi:hypothetical protein
MLFVLGIIIVFDFLLGIAEARKNNIPITSKRMKEGIFGKIFILILPFIVALVIKGIGREELSQHFVSFIISTLIISEGYSSIGHIYNFKTGEHLPENDAVSTLIKKI